MKKTLVSALTTALVVGAASTTFAAANPFEDVPADHWAYDAVAQLAADGVIEGYGDGTYRGDQEITRYEMAQMVARAMAKGATGADKAMIDKLAAEFADELNNLGVRVAALEKKVDNVKWGGRLRYRYIKRTVDKMKTDETRTNQYLLRLEPVMTINEHWVGKARIDYGQKRDFATGKNLNGDNLTVDRIYAEGTYGNTKIQLGKFPGYSNADYGMIFAYREAGAKVTFGKDVKVGVSAARLNLNDAKFLGGGESGPTATHLELEVYNDRSKKFTWGIGYHNLSNKAFFDDNDGINGYLGNQRANIIDVGLGYKFTDKLGFTAAYAKNTSVDGNAGAKSTKNGDSVSKSSVDQSYNFQLNYGGAVKTKPGSWGAYIAYRHLGQASTIRSDYSELGPIYNNERGWEIGASVAPMKNTTLFVKYFMGNKIAGEYSGNKVHGFFTELNLWF